MHKPETVRLNPTFVQHDFCCHLGKAHEANFELFVEISNQYESVFMKSLDCSRKTLSLRWRNNELKGPTNSYTVNIDKTLEKEKYCLAVFSSETLNESEILSMVAQLWLWLFI